MNRIEMGELVARLRDLQSQAAGGAEVPGDRATPSFAETLVRSLEQVNDMQREAIDLARAFELGAKDVDLVEVMVASQKAGLAFQAVTEVRNHLVRAYQDVMNMPV